MHTPSLFFRPSFVAGQALIALSVSMLLPTFSHAATPPSTTSIAAHVQERLNQRLHKTTVASFRSQQTVRVALDLSNLSNLGDQIKQQFNFSSSKSSTASSVSSRSSLSSPKSSSSASSIRAILPPASSSVSSKSSVSSRSSTASSVSSTSNFVRDVLNLVNQERAKEGLARLTHNALLEKSAVKHAQDMKSNNYFDHTGLNGSSPTQRIKAEGYPNVSPCNCNRRFYYGENIARGQTTPAQVVRDWMNSPGHRANIMSKNFKEIGIGIAGTYWVQNFGGVWDQ
jgi:uncharacterized protein YkwD